MTDSKISGAAISITGTKSQLLAVLHNLPDMKGTFINANDKYDRYEYDFDPNMMNSNDIYKMSIMASPTHANAPTVFYVIKYPYRVHPFRIRNNGKNRLVLELCKKHKVIINKKDYSMQIEWNKYLNAA
jgi:hypothetical protein